MNAPDREIALEDMNRLYEERGARYQEAVGTLTKDQDQQLVFFDLPVQHWIRLPMTNTIESPFAAVET